MQKSQTDLANINLKIHLMEKALGQNTLKPNYRFECLYHDVPLVFYSSEKSFVQYLQAYVPQAWQLKVSDSLQVVCLHSDHRDFENYGPYEIFEKDNYIIQRDFIAKEEKGIVYILFNQNLSSFPDGFHNSMRWILFDRFVDYQKLCLHSSIVIDQNLAYVFLGHSGAGKSTTTQLSSPRIHLGDDMNVISLNGSDNSFYAEAALLGQAYDISQVSGVKFNIQGFYWLNQSPKHELVSYTKTQALSKLLQSIPNVKLDSIKSEKVLKFCRQIIERYPMYQLNFCRDGHFWEKIYEQNL
jgi:hypothetical protein